MHTRYCFNCEPLIRSIEVTLLQEQCPSKSMACLRSASNSLILFTADEISQKIGELLSPDETKAEGQIIYQTIGIFIRPAQNI